jgi:medium-chain acyl-[acyl-carrier-protein] hydrolase
LSEKSSLERWLPLRDGRRSGALRLFVFPYAGGRATSFRAWSRGLPESVEVLALQLPGREQRISEPPLGSVAQAVEAILPVITPLLDRPFAFFGHSLGGLVAYEVALALRARGGPLPAHFFASGSRAPHAPLPEDPAHLLRGEAFLERLRLLGGTPPEVLACRELMDLFTPMLLADLRMSETYRAQRAEPLPVPLTALGGTEDAEVRPERLEAWADIAGAGFELVWLPGGHFFVHAEERAVLDVVARALAPYAR